MLVSLSTACLYSFPLRRTFTLAAEAGYDGVELVMGPEARLRGARYVTALAQEYALPVLSVHQTLLDYLPHQGYMHVALRLALELGCLRVVIHGPETWRWGEAPAQRWLRALALCQHHLAGRPTRLAIETPGGYARSDDWKVLGQPTLLASFAARHDLDITLDTCHAGSRVLEDYQAVRERLANVHLSDIKPARDDQPNHLLHTFLVHHQMPGEGRLPLALLRSRMRQDGFAGPLTLELSPLALQAWSQRALQHRLAQALAWARG